MTSGRGGSLESRRGRGHLGGGGGAGQAKGVGHASYSRAAMRVRSLHTVEWQALARPVARYGCWCSLTRPSLSVSQYLGARWVTGW